MKTQNGMPEVDAGIPENAVSLYGPTDAMDDFPVLKAFQQYIDAEQAKSRKRLMILCAFFGAVMFVVIAVFVGLLLNVSSRNQSLNDRLIEYAMQRDRERSQAMAPAAAQDNAAAIALTAKIEELQKKLFENQARAEQMVAEASAQAKKAAIEAATPKAPTPEELEITRLKALLAIEKEKHAAEQEKRRQEELEAYRRKHYPELYGLQPKTDEPPRKKPSAAKKEAPKPSAHDELLDEVDRILGEDEAVRYYDDEDAKEKPAAAPRAAPKKEYSIPVDIRGSSSHWNIPND